MLASLSLVLLRVLRILRLLRLLSWIPELNIIMRAISSSAVALFYVILLVFLFFFHFAIAGVLLFKTNDPQHFKSFFRAMVSLFQVPCHAMPLLTSFPSSLCLSVLDLHS
jgi:voltage-gated sodium channel